MLDSALETAIRPSRRQIDRIDVPFRRIYVHKYTTADARTFQSAIT
jgi:hypothetical protein